MKFVLCLFSLSFFFSCLPVSSSSSVHFNISKSKVFKGNNGGIAKTIVVDQSGHGNFITVQSAINSVPSGNNEWIKIYVKNGIYNEMVVIPSDKRKIVMEGEDISKTTIQYNGVGQAIDSATFKMSAEYFVAISITFKNTYNKVWPAAEKAWRVAPAAVVMADKAAFLRCNFISLQDTLADFSGRHLFHNCYIEGAVDFIWGFGQSIYQGCEINVSGDLGGIAGFITAQGRVNSEDTSGYVFMQCKVYGNTKTFLGRAYRQYSRVLFYQTTMSDIIVPQGWDAWTYQGHEETITYAEVGCGGEGAKMGGRVKWEKTLSPQDISFLTNPKTFIDQDGWLQTLPISISFST